MKSLAAIAALLFVTNFEVAAIHPHDPNIPAATMKYLPGGTVSIQGMSIRI